VIVVLDVGLGLTDLDLGLDLVLGRVWSLHVDLIFGLELCLSLVVGLTVINSKSWRKSI
jgi:hypothetical protein